MIFESFLLKTIAKLANRAGELFDLSVRKVAIDKTVSSRCTVFPSRFDCADFRTRPRKCNETSAGDRKMGMSLKGISMKKFVLIGLMGTLTLLYQNCSGTNFEVDNAEKAIALKQESVFDLHHGDDGMTAGGVADDAHITGPSTTATPTSGMPTSGMPTTSAPTSGSMPDADMAHSLSISFGFLCSNVQSQAAGGNLLSASAVKVVIAKAGEQTPICELNGDFKSEILNKKQLSLKLCGGLEPGNYSAYIVDTKVPYMNGKMTIEKSLTHGLLKFSIASDGTVKKGSGGKVDILYDLNNAHQQYSSLNKQYSSSTKDTQKDCDKRASPLIVSMESSARGIKLSSPLEGVQFDILGARSAPRAHAMKQISWMVAEDHEYYFIALPNKQGQVLGIDELFGDNTYGPDRKFAENGYAALAKYDDDRDHLITPHDEVFEKLRLWKDSNLDGIAQPNELYTLKEKGVALIDLRYDKRYQETDIYGNQTLMKSVVKTEDGKLHLLFDLWFRYINIP